MNRFSYASSRRITSPQLRSGLAVLALTVATAAPASAQAGTLDASFGTDGKVLTDILGDGYDFAVDAVHSARGNDGKIVVLGASEGFLNSQDHGTWLIQRYLEDGTPDPGFGIDGAVTFDANGSHLDSVGQAPAGVALDGNAIVVAGWRQRAFTGPEVVVARFREDGGLDPTFGVAGVAVYPHASCFGLAVENGRILVGTHAQAGGASQVLALSPNGSVSSSYGDSGVADLGAYYGMIRMLGRGDGGVFLVGRDGNLTTGLHIWVVALDQGGNLDASFGGGGIVHTVSSDRVPVGASLRPGGGIALLVRAMSTAENEVRRYSVYGAHEGSFLLTSLYGYSDLAVAADDSVFISGSSTTAGAAVARYFTSGQLDTSFGSNGVALHTLDGTYANARLVEPLPSGAILVIGNRNELYGPADLFVARLTPLGGLDSTFGGGSGYATIQVLSSSQWDEARDLVVMQGDGRILVVGTSWGNGAETSGPVLLRYEADGSLDATFGEDGIRFFGGQPPEGPNLSPVALALQSTGRILVTGYSPDPSGNDPELTVVGLDPAGVLDPSFGVDGTASISLPGNQTARVMAVLSDDRIVLGGTTYESGSWDAIVALLMPDGSLDTSFGNSGYVVFGNAGTGTGVVGLAVDGDGRIVTAVGLGGEQFELGIVAADGSSVDHVPTALSGRPTNLVLDGLGRWIVGLQSGISMNAVRFTPDGHLDPTFGSGGIATLTVGTSCVTTAVAVQGDRKVIAIGASLDSSHYERFVDFAVVRWDENGAPDLDFGTGGAAIADFHTSDFSAIPETDYPEAVAIQGDGSILVAGFVYRQNFYLSDVQEFDIALARFHGVTTPLALIENLVPIVQVYAELGLLNNGQANSLQSKLAACLQLLESGNTTAAIHQIESFQNQVLAMIEAGTLSEEDGQPLLDWAEDILLELGDA